MDADTFHSAANIQKMSQGIPLEDVDRWPWLDKIRKAIQTHKGARPIILACSALKASYRNRLQLERCPIFLLTGTTDLINQRLRARSDHFMPSKLLNSQFEILEVDEAAIPIQIEQSPDKITDQIVQFLDKGN